VLSSRPTDSHHRQLCFFLLYHLITFFFHLSIALLFFPHGPHSQHTSDSSSILLTGETITSSAGHSVRLRGYWSAQHGCWVPEWSVWQYATSCVEEALTRFPIPLSTSFLFTFFLLPKKPLVESLGMASVPAGMATAWAMACQR
jgi:hypothetical protein